MSGFLPRGIGAVLLPSCCHTCAAVAWCPQQLPASPVPGAAPASPSLLCLQHQARSVSGLPGQALHHRSLPWGQCPLLLRALGMLCGAAWHSMNDFCCFFSPTADDQAPCQAAGLWPRRGAGHQGARLLPLHRLGQAGAQRDSASLQAKGCKCDCVKCAPPLPLSRTLFLSCTVSHSRWWVHTHTSICAGATHLTRSVEVSHSPLQKITYL